MATRLATLAAATALTCALAREAHAQSTGDAAALDCVMPNARERVCGRLESIDPDRRALSIRLANGSIRQVSWYAIVTAWGPSFPARRTGRDADLPLANTVHVELESTGAPQTIELTWADATPVFDDTHARSAGTLRRAECTTPCRVHLPPGAVAVRASGPEIATHAVALSIPTSAVRVRLQAPSRERHRVAEILATVGSSMMIAGLIFPLAVVANGYLPPAQEPYFWGSLGVSAAGTIPAITSLIVDEPAGVAGIDRLCRAASAGSPAATHAPWSQSLPSNAATDAHLPAPPRDESYVLCR